MSCKIKKSTPCCVIGYGSWATALVKILLENDNEVFWYIKNPKILTSVKTLGYNKKYLREVIFSSKFLTPTNDINHAVSSSGVVILAAPSAFLKKTLKGLTVSLDDKFIISAIKGIITPELVTTAEYINEAYNIPFDRLGVITGPCHAEEVALERLSYLTVVCKDQDNAKVLSEKIACKYILTSCSTDIYGVEYATILKNIYAIAVGMAFGIGYGDNFNAVLISNAAMEINRFLEKTYPTERDSSASAYLGDLLVTCYSKFSRNRNFGIMIGRGYRVNDVKIEMDMVAEGYYAADCVNQINTKFGVDMPIASCVYSVLYEGKNAEKALAELSEKLI